MIARGEVLKVMDIAKMLRVSGKTVRRWITDGNLKATKIGRHYFILKSDFETKMTASYFGKEGES